MLEKEFFDELAKYRGDFILDNQQIRTKHRSCPLVEVHNRLFPDGSTMLPGLYGCTAGRSLHLPTNFTYSVMDCSDNVKTSKYFGVSMRQKLLDTLGLKEEEEKTE